MVITGPHALVERTRDGHFPLLDLLGARKEAPAGRQPDTSRPMGGLGGASRTPPISVTVSEIVVRGGALAWRDATLKPEARLDFGAIDASVRGAGWPLKGPLTTRASLQPPGGGQVRFDGRVAVEPPGIEGRVIASNAALAPYQPYVPTTAHVTGTAHADLAITMPSFAEQRATARGTVTVAGIDVRDGQRTVVRAERATATEVDAAWPERIAIGRLALARPWLLLERDDQGGMPLRALVPSAKATPPAAPAATAPGTTAPGADAPAERLSVTVARLTVEEGGVRVVDRAINPPFAVDVDAARLSLDGLSSVAARPARLDLTARVGGAAELALRGTIGALDAPLKLDLDGEIREFAVPRANSYLVSQVGWKSREGRLTAKLRARVDGDALNAKSDIRISRLQLVKAGPEDQAQARIGLPLGMLTSLMKDKRGDITVSFPVGGRLSDPRFDFRETMWTAVRTVAINAVTLPVSWIGKVQFTADSRIQKIQVDPVTFEPGTADLTADGRARIGKLTAFLEQLPAVRMALTPVVSSRDVAAIKQKLVETRVAREARPSAEGSALPLATLVERTPVPASAVTDLGTRRLEVVRAAFKEAGVDPDRLTETAVAERQGAEAEIELEVLEPEGQRPSKVREVLKKFGFPLKGNDD